MTKEPEEFLEERKIALHRYLQKVCDGEAEGEHDGVRET